MQSVGEVFGGFFQDKVHLRFSLLCPL